MVPYKVKTVKGKQRKDGIVWYAMNNCEDRLESSLMNVRCGPNLVAQE